MVTESDSVVQTNFIRSCLEISTCDLTIVGRALSTVFPSRQIGGPDLIQNSICKCNLI